MAWLMNASGVGRAGGGVQSIQRRPAAVATRCGVAARHFAARRRAPPPCAAPTTHDLLLIRSDTDRLPRYRPADGRRVGCGCTLCFAGTPPLVVYHVHRPDGPTRCQRQSIRQMWCGSMTPSVAAFSTFDWGRDAATLHLSAGWLNRTRVCRHPAQCPGRHLVSAGDQKWIAVVSRCRPRRRWRLANEHEHLRLSSGLSCCCCCCGRRRRRAGCGRVYSSITMESDVSTGYSSPLVVH